MKNIVMPKLGLTMTEGTVSKWHKAAGDAVKEGEPLFDVETDKLTNTIEASASGTLLKIYVPEGGTAKCLEKVAVIGAEGEAAPEEEAPAAAPAPEKAAPAEAGSVLVLGGGPGGYVAAIRAAQLGAKVTLVEKQKIGGTCLNRGCMPTKALLHSAEVYELATHSQDIGIIGRDVAVDWAKVQANRQSVSDRLTSGVAALMRANKISVVDGEAVFTGPKTVKVGDKTLAADKIIIAVGSKPAMPPVPGLKGSKAVLDSTGALTLDHIPDSLLVIGGGVIGLELGSVYMRFGSKVTVVEMMDKLLPLMDAELTGIVQAQLQAAGMEILTSSSAVSVKDGPAGAEVTVKTPDGEKVITAEKILVSTGRTPNTEGLGLDKAGVASEKGYITANERMETNVPGVYAVGDCNGKLMLAHAAMAMGEAAAENAMGGDASFYPEQSPSCCYVGPEFACVGLTEADCAARGIEVKVGRFPTSANGKSLVGGHTDGMIKVVAGAKYGEILGVHILAEDATDIIEEAALAIRLEATLDELVDTIHCHPTVSEGLREAALAADKRAVHIPNRR